MQFNEIIREILRRDVPFMCWPCVQVRGRDNFELLMKIKDSLELVDLVPQPLLDSYRQQTQQQLLQRPWVTVTVHHRPATSKPDKTVRLDHRVSSPLFHQGSRIASLFLLTAIQHEQASRPRRPGQTVVSQPSAGAAAAAAPLCTLLHAPYG